MFEYSEFISPVALSILGFDIRWYSLSYIFGFLYFFWFSHRNLKVFNLDKKLLEDLFFFNFLGIILGGRLGYVFFYDFDFYITNPLSIIKIWEGGMSFHGAITGCIISAIYFCNKNKISLFKISDLMCLTAPIGIGLGRIANFLNQELVGRKTDFFISIKYPNEIFYRHISQIYESLLEGFIPFIVLNICYFMFKFKTGLITGIFLINYAIVRFFIEFLREPDIQIGFIKNYFTIGQILSIPLLILGLLITFICLYKKK